MTITLPILPLGSQTDVTFNTNAIQATPSLGGQTQRLARMGDRFTYKVTARAMNYAQGAQVVSYLVAGMNDLVVCPVAQPSLAIGSPGTPLVNGASQAGSSLILDGLTANYAFQPGQYVSIVTGGQHFLHMVTSAETANGSGQVTIPIKPMLRVSPADNDVVEIAQPNIEGFLSGTSQNWTIDLVQSIGLTFSITESQ